MQLKEWFVHRDNVHGGGITHRGFINDLHSDLFKGTVGWSRDKMGGSVGNTMYLLVIPYEFIRST